MSGKDPANKPVPAPAKTDSTPPAQHNGNGSDTALTEMLKKRQQRISSSPDSQPAPAPDTQQPQKKPPA